MKTPINILIISQNYFLPAHDGVTVRDYNLFRNLSQKFTLDLLTFGEKGFTPNCKELGECFNHVEIIPTNSLNLIKPLPPLKRIHNFFFPALTSMGDKYFSPTMEKQNM